MVSGNIIKLIFNPPPLDFSDFIRELKELNLTLLEDGSVVEWTEEE